MTDLPSFSELAAKIDHAILKPEVTRAELSAQIDELLPYDIFALCVRPSDLPFVSKKLAGRVTKPITVIGFPHGTGNTAGKVAETKQAIADGAQEIDVVINISALRSGLIPEVIADLSAVVAAAKPLPVKVILETSLLNAEQIAEGSKAAAEAGAAFVKTSTGFAGGGANLTDLKIMKDSVPAEVQLKASGGIRDLDTLLEMLAFGVTRFGTSATITLLEDLKQRLATGVATGKSDQSSY